MTNVDILAKEISEMILQLEKLARESNNPFTIMFDDGKEKLSFGFHYVWNGQEEEEILKYIAPDMWYSSSLDC